MFFLCFSAREIQARLSSGRLLASSLRRTCKWPNTRLLWPFSRPSLRRAGSGWPQPAGWSGPQPRHAGSAHPCGAVGRQPGVLDSGNGAVLAASVDVFAVDALGLRRRSCKSFGDLHTCTYTTGVGFSTSEAQKKNAGRYSSVSDTRCLAQDRSRTLTKRALYTTPT